MQRPAQRQRRQRSPGARGRGQITDAEHGAGHARQDTHAATSVAVAMAAIPSERPVKPSRSEVVALTETAPASIPMIRASACRIAAEWGPILGCSQISVQSILPMR